MQLPGPLPPWADELREDLYLPVPSLRAWRDKARFLQLVEVVELDVQLQLDVFPSPATHAI